MSHTSTIRSVPIKDIAALHSAVAELQAKGIKLELIENATPRMFYANQVPPCAYVIRLTDSQYDVGLQKQPDGSFHPVLDTWKGHVSRVLGAACSLESGTPLHAIGQLMQAYSKHAAINAAVNQGYTVDSSYIDDEGNVQLELSVS